MWTAKQPADYGRQIRFMDLQDKEGKTAIQTAQEYTHRGCHLFTNELILGSLNALVM